MIDLYFWPTGNGKKIVILLEELGLPYTIKPINIGRGDQLTPEFLKISPNGRMPAIVDDEPMGGGAPISVPSSSARITQGRGTDPRPIGNRFATQLIAGGKRIRTFGPARRKAVVPKREHPRAASRSLPGRPQTISAPTTVGQPAIRS